MMKFTYWRILEKGNSGTAPPLFSLCKSKRVEEGMALFLEMSQRGLDTKEMRNSELFQAGDVDMAQEVFKEMESDGVPPSIMTYSILLDGLCNNGKLEKALVVFEYMQKSEMKLKGVKPNAVTYTIMLSGFCRKGLKEEADALFRKMKEDGPLPDSGTYNTMIRARLRDGDKAASAELIKEMRSCEFSGDASTIGLLANML